MLALKIIRGLSYKIYFHSGNMIRNLEDKKKKNIGHKTSKKSEVKKETHDYLYTNRSRNSKSLVMIIAGYQEYLWDKVFTRIHDFCPDNFDVCICVPGQWGKSNISKLESIAEEYNWSFLHLVEDRLAVAQNICISLHSDADWIYKFDEDMFVTKGYFEKMKSTYEQIEKESSFIPGVLYPVINVNGATSEYLINKLDIRTVRKELMCLQDNLPLKREYLGLFSKHPEAAGLIWTGLPHIDVIAENLAENEEAYWVLPIGFSIGAFLMSKKRYEEFGGFYEAPIGALGEEEIDLIRKCALMSRPGFVASRCFVGHFGFYTQKENLRAILTENPRCFDYFCDT